MKRSSEDFDYVDVEGGDQDLLGLPGKMSPTKSRLKKKSATLEEGIIKFLLKFYFLYTICLTSLECFVLDYFLYVLPNS